MLKSVLTSAFAALALSACATQAPKSFDLSANTDEALVILGMKSDVGPYTINFYVVDPKTCQPHPLGLNGQGFDHRSPFSPTAWKARDRHYIMATFKPGQWLLASMTYDSGLVTTVPFEGRTLAFNARPGEFIYLGDVTFNGRNLQFDGFDHEGVAAHLAEFPAINQTPVEQPKWFTPYRKGGKVTNCGDTTLAAR